MYEPYDDRTEFLAEEAIRVEIALVCQDGPLTRTEIGKRLDRHPGSLSAIGTLEKKGALRPTKNGRGRGSQTASWTLDPDWRGAVRDASGLVKTGILSPGLDLVLVSTRDLSAASELFASRPDHVAWGVPLKGEQLGMMVCPSILVDEGKTLALIEELGVAGVQSIRLHAPAILNRPELGDWAEGLGRGRNQSLPTG
jgi:hypothetical protein